MIGPQLNHSTRHAGMLLLDNLSDVPTPLRWHPSACCVDIRALTACWHPSTYSILTLMRVAESPLCRGRFAQERFLSSARFSVSRTCWPLWLTSRSGAKQLRYIIGCAYEIRWTFPFFFFWFPWRRWYSTLYDNNWHLYPLLFVKSSYVNWLAGKPKLTWPSSTSKINSIIGIFAIKHSSREWVR